MFGALLELVMLKSIKSARRCGAKHISKSKCTKHVSLRPLLEVEMSKKWTQSGAKHISKSKVQKTEGMGHFWAFRCRFSWQAQGIVHLVKKQQKREVAVSFTTTTIRHYTPLHYTLHYNNNYNYITLHYTFCITLQYATLY